MIFGLPNRRQGSTYAPVKISRLKYVNGVSSAEYRRQGSTYVPVKISRLRYTHWPTN